ncbi:MAG TPA: sugar phosphate isomerase/epimerase family protein [Rhodothermales bacterium]
MMHLPRTPNSRRDFVRTVTGAAAFTALGAWRFADAASDDPIFKLSLSQWCFHRAIFGPGRDDYDWFVSHLASDPDAVLQGDMDPRDIVVRAREIGVDAVDYVNICFFGHAGDIPWLTDLKRRADAEGVKSLMIMCDQTGRLGHADPEMRLKSVEDHTRWLEAAQFLGCHSIRVNAYGDGTYLEQLERCAEGIGALAERAEPMGLNVLIENHGDASNTGIWLAMLIQKISHPRVMALADFDNFFMGGWNEMPERRYDRYQGLMDIAPYTHSVSAKAHGFNEDGSELRTDFHKAMRILLDAGFRGYASIEYEGDQLSEMEGAVRTKALLEKVRSDLTVEYR